MDTLDFEEVMLWLTGGEEDEEPVLAFEEKYDINADLAFKLVKDLLPLCEIGKSPLTGEKYRGFAANGQWLAKLKIYESRI